MQSENRKMIDIHCHTLFGVDDGSDSFETSQAMLRCAAEDGIRVICLTPHYHKTRTQASDEELKERVGALRKFVKEEGLPLQLVFGNELFFSQDSVKDLNERKARRLNATEYVLVEFDPGCEYTYIANAMSQLQTGGYRPVIAHVERYLCILDKPERVTELRSRGVIIQVNASSVTGDFGRKVQQFCRKLLKEEKIDLVASDAHNMHHRKPVLSKAREAVEKKFGNDYADRLFYRNPLKILKGEGLS